MSQKLELSERRQPVDKEGLVEPISTRIVPTHKNHTILMKRILVVAAALAASASFNLKAATAITGSGATFPAPLYVRWASDFHKRTRTRSSTISSVGSGAGIKNFTAGVTDFGASDVAMKDEEISKVHGNVLMIPATAGTIVFAYNLPANPARAETHPRRLYLRFFLGKIKSWNDPAIAKANPGVTLPNLPITTVARSDGSGTNLGSLPATFPSELEIQGQGSASGKSVTLPTGVAGKGNEGVTALIKQTPGAIGYVEYGYAANNKLTMASLQNRRATSSLRQ